MVAHLSSFFGVLLVCFGLTCCVSSSVSVKTVRRKSQRCDYTLVVQEFDPSLCPSMLARGSTTTARVAAGAAAGGSSPRSSLSHHHPSPPGANVTSSGRTGGNDETGVPGYFQDGVVPKEQARRSSAVSSRESHLTNALNEMVRKIEETEAKLDSTISTNTRLGASSDSQSARLDRLDSQIKDFEQARHLGLGDLEARLQQMEQNLTRMTDDLAKVTADKSYWKSVDMKLAGLMLDMTEMSQAMTKHDRQMEKLGVVEKVIEVQAMTEVVSCSISPNSTRYRDCEDYFMNGHTKSGVYYIIPLYSTCPIPVYCDMDTPPGGWMVIQRRMDGSVSFNRNWTDYRRGFGSVGQEFWMGLDNIFLLTSQKAYELRVDLWDFFGSRVHATYGKFHVGGEREGYQLNVANHSGSIPDGMQHHNNIQFSTPDRDQDTYPEYHCAKEWGAGWWFANCWFAILNGQYYNQSQVEYRGISWNEWKNEQLQKTEMKIRPSTID